MEKFTPEIEKKLNEKLFLYRELNDLLKEERDFIVKIDVDSLWKTAQEKRRISDRIQAIREEILSCMERQMGVENLDIHSFSLSMLIRTLPVSNDQKMRFRQIKLAIDAEKDELKQAAQDNKRYVREYLVVIDDIMAVAVDNSNQAQYSHTGVMPTTKSSNRLIHAEV